MAVLAPRRPVAPRLSPTLVWLLIAALVAFAWLGGWLLPLF